MRNAVLILGAALSMAIQPTEVLAAQPYSIPKGVDVIIGCFDSDRAVQAAMNFGLGNTAPVQEFVNRKECIPIKKEHSPVFKTLGTQKKAIGELKVTVFYVQMMKWNGKAAPDDFKFYVADILGEVR
ncbi:hypothetical protein [Magnetospirillum sp. 15-1]|uniref:hypothetical protein n=1 Tax=Magnetospirillum sp. 15-1 TaxID=1979370 RepID=UPI0011449E9D|nr:hypothetical protein [Magnetospirillum sp. 15-1]